MQKIPVIMPGLIVLIVACLLIAGCSSTDTTNQTAQPGTTTNTGALYTAGDIAKNPASTASSAYLVLKYDAASDTYERALIYQNADGSWGYRSDNRTEKASRSVMDKVYTEKLAHTSPSSVPIVTPTGITPAETAQTPGPATTVTITALKAPFITSIIPDEGIAGANVSVQNLAGGNFTVGATARLSHNTSIIQALDVRYISNKSLICTFVIPSDAAAGSWDVTVTNPDGQSDTFTKIFTIHSATSATTTTSPALNGSVAITSIEPSFAYSHNYREFIITGSKFQAGAGVTLQKEGKPDIVGQTVSVTSDTQIHCFFDIPYESQGAWDIVITNPDQTSGKRAGGFEVRQ
jgi:hypothetical protein